ncbi:MULTISPECIES: hypothetical protein [Bacillaceae]|nr:MULTISPECIES: hypothetical protein [Bacillaceae]
MKRKVLANSQRPETPITRPTVMICYDATLTQGHVIFIGLFEKTLIVEI